MLLVLLFPKTVTVKLCRLMRNWMALVDIASEQRAVHSRSRFTITYKDKRSSNLLSKNLKIKIYRTIILPVVLYGCET